MSLDEKATLPRFFVPYQAKINPFWDKETTEYLPLFDKLDLDDRPETSQDFVEKFIEHSDLPQEEFPPAPRYQDYGVFGFPDLVESRGKPSWQLMAAWDMPLHKKPHIKCMLTTQTVAEDCLLYSELVTIIGIIHQRLRTRETRRHVDAPVFLYSFVDTSIRVIEGNFDGTNLVVRATKLFDLTGDDRKGYELSMSLAKWWYGDSLMRLLGEAR